MALRVSLLKIISLFFCPLASASGDIVLLLQNGNEHQQVEEFDAYTCWCEGSEPEEYLDCTFAKRSSAEQIRLDLTQASVGQKLNRVINRSRAAGLVVIGVEGLNSRESLDGLHEATFFGAPGFSGEYEIEIRGSSRGAVTEFRVYTNQLDPKGLMKTVLKGQKLGLEESYLPHPLVQRRFREAFEL